MKVNRAIISLVVVVLVVGAVIALYSWPMPLSEQGLQNQKGSVQKPGLVRFKFTELEPGVVAQTSDYTLAAPQWQKMLKSDPVFTDLSRRKFEIATALIYRQFVLAATAPVQNLVVHSPLPLRPVAALFNNYGVTENGETSLTIEHRPQEPFSFIVDGVQHPITDIDTQQSLWWGDVESKIFRRKLKAIDEYFKNRYLAAAAKAADLAPEAWLEDQVYKGHSFTASADELVKIQSAMGLAESAESAAIAQSHFATTQKERLKNYFLEKELMNLPIAVDIRRPSFNYEVKLDWTPSQGPEDADLKVIVFADFWTLASQQILREISRWSQEFPNVFFGLRPVVLSDQRFQQMLSEATFCGWVADREKFWPFLEALTTVKREQFDNDLEQAWGLFEAKAPAVKECFFARRHQEVASYHQKYGEFLQLASVPLVIVGGEIFLGAPAIEDIAEAIARHLNEPSAAVLRQ